LAKPLSKVEGGWDSWSSISDDVDNLNIIAASQGMPGSGKTHFWLTAPEPIAYFHFDPAGLKGLRGKKEFKKKDIRYMDYCEDLNIGKLEKGERIDKSLEVLEKFQRDWDVAIENARTLIVDKEQMLWECLRYAHDEVDSPTPKNFHELNTLYRGWIQDAENHKCNLGLLRDVHDTWGVIGTSREGKKQMGFTGIMKPDGQKYVPGNVQINLNHRWDAEESCFQVKILEKCRLGNAVGLIGTEYQNLDFMTLAFMLFPDTSPDDWGY
jgi:hypothetical protein